MNISISEKRQDFYRLHKKYLVIFALTFFQHSDHCFTEARLQNSAAVCAESALQKQRADATQKLLAPVPFRATAPEPHPIPQFLLPFSFTFYIISIVQMELPEQDFPQGGMCYVRARFHDARPHDV